MLSVLLRTIAIVGCVLAGSLGVAVPGARGAPHVAYCPEVTNSIDRLYAAFFLRPPDATGLAYWVDRYTSGQRNLRQIAAGFEESPEFLQRYGSLSNRQFVNLVYRNVLDRAPDASGEEFWIGELNDGYPRAALMIGFSESPEFVDKTGTTRPLAGYGRIYPVGTTFTCGFGTGLFEISKQSGAQFYDLLLINYDDDPNQAELRTVDAESRVNDRLANVELAKHQLILATGLLADELPHFADTTALWVRRMGPSTYWTVAFLPGDPIAPTEDRPGWGSDDAPLTDRDLRDGTPTELGLN